MNSSPTLSTASLEHPAMDYAFLRQEGIQHLERLAGQIWTDFNAHDPGITILEQVCYALTDLAYRINYELPDLLTRAGESTYDSLYSPAQIFTSQPVTLTDLRKLVIDVEGVKNAWVEPVEAQSPTLFFQASENALSLQGDAFTAEPIYLKGLYRVLIEISDVLYIDSAVQQQEIIRQATRRLQANRNLAEDFEEIRILEPQPIQVQARVEIEAVEDADAVLQEIYRRMADYISPPVRFYSLNQLLEAGKPVDEIFEGPLLEHGFIDSEQLRQAQRRTVLHTSDLIRAIMDVAGVRAVRTISLAAGGTPEAWLLNLDPNKVPKLDLSGSVITLERNRLMAGVNVTRVVNTHYQALRHRATFTNLALGERDLQPPPGRERHLETYYSLQHQFPATYGIGAMGLPESATPQRQAQAKQLKAYLLFFDQLLANYFAQLAHFKDLFSFSQPTDQSYFAQPVDDSRLGLEGIRRSDLAAHQTRLQQITENPYVAEAQPDFRRRNRFLNHLLARFAEQFTDYSLILYGVMSKEADNSAAEKLAQDKRAFLQDYPYLSSARGTGFNYLQPRSSANRSGLEQRLYRKLGLTEPAEYFYLVEHILLRPMEGDAPQQAPILAAPRLKDPYSLQLSFVFPNWSPRFKNPNFKAFIERTIREETPAHLSLTIHWFGQTAMTAFEPVYQDWLDKRRNYWSDKLGV
ncbi:MAG: hypothetical protein U0401_33225 [Anaerolineae bacterium]